MPVPKGYVFSAERNAKISKANKGRVFTLEHCAAISASAKNRAAPRWSDSAHPHSFCKECRPELGTKHPNPTWLKGHKTPEHQAKITAALKNLDRRAMAAKHNSLDLPNCRCYVHGAARPYMISSYTWKLADALTAAGFEMVIAEAQFGLKRVDCLLAEEWLALEADGNYHFTPERRTYDAKRDQVLLERFGLPVVRLSGAEVEHLWKELCADA